MCGRHHHKSQNFGYILSYKWLETLVNSIYFIRIAFKPHSGKLRIDGTGSQIRNFDTERIQGDLNNAELFGDKFAETFSPEASVNLEEAKKRIERLNAKPEVITGVPNALLYYGVIALGIYGIYKILS